MKFSNRVDVALPADRLFAQLTDIPALERAALKKGVVMRRLDSLTDKGAGLSWEVGFRLRGKPRQMAVEVTRYDAPVRIEYCGLSAGFEVRLVLEFTALAPRRSRMSTLLEIKPRTLGGRLLLQSARLGRAKLDRRYDERIKSFLRDLESRAA